MTKNLFSTNEWKTMVNAPQWVFTALVASDRGAISTRRTETKALEKFLAEYKTLSPLVKDILAGQADAEKVSGSLEDAEKVLDQINTLLEKRVSEDEGNAVRDLLVKAGQVIAEANREQLFGGSVSGTEKKTLARIEAALQATEADKRRRREVAAAAKPAPAPAPAAAPIPTPVVPPAPAPVAAAAGAVGGGFATFAQQAKEAAERAEAQKKNIAEEAQRKAEEAKAAAAEAQRKAEEAAKAAAAAAVEAGTMRTYVVVSGDTLSGIAKKFYGDFKRWPEIYEANKDLIKDPNLIHIGWKLRIP